MSVSVWVGSCMYEGQGYTCKQSSLSLFRVLATVEEGAEFIEPDDLDRVEAHEKPAGQEASDAHNGRRGHPPW